MRTIGILFPAVTIYYVPIVWFSQSERSGDPALRGSRTSRFTSGTTPGQEDLTSGSIKTQQNIRTIGILFPAVTIYYVPIV
jgi:hypothetical protein